MNIQVTAIGSIKQYIPAEKKEIEIEEKKTVGDLIKYFGIPKNIGVICIVNNSIVKNNYLFENGDNAIFLMAMNGG